MQAYHFSHFIVHNFLNPTMGFIDSVYNQTVKILSFESGLLGRPLDVYQLIVSSKKYHAVCKLSYLGYYLALWVYAIINLFMMFAGILQLPIPLSAVLSVAATLLANANEVINMYIITNPARSTPLQKAKGYPLTTTAIITTLCALACLDLYTGIYNMTLIQKNNLQSLGVPIPVTLMLWYNAFFITTGLVSHAMSYLTNFIHFTQGSNEQKADHNVQKTNQNASFFNRCLCNHIKYPVTLTLGLGIGSFLYAFADYQVLGGLLLMLVQLNMLQMNTAYIFVISAAFSLCTMLERILFWGHNFRRFENDHKSQFTGKNYLFHAIPKSPVLRKTLTAIRVGLMAIKGFLNVMVYFTGWKKYIGFLSTFSYITAIHVQNTLQSHDFIPDRDSKNENQAAATHPVVSGGGFVCKS